MYGPVALVTGAAHRLGQALAFGFAAAGHRVAVHYRGAGEAAAETCAALVRAGSPAEPFPADLAEPAAPARLVGQVLERFGRLDVLVHSASPWIEKPWAEVSAADWDLLAAVGPRAAFLLAQAASPALSAAEGAILLVSDVAAGKAWPRHLPHAVAKAGLDALVRNLAVALAPAVRVNGIAPGIVLPPPGMDEAIVERLVAATPLRRRVAVEDVVSMAVALAANRSVTGQVVAIDCGRAVV